MNKIISDIQPDSLRNLRRPGLLVQAARHCLGQFKKDRDLRQIIKSAPPKSDRALTHQLLAIETELETARKTGDASYSLHRHILVLTALMNSDRR